MTEKEKMLAGEVYSAIDTELIEELMATKEVLYEYNSLRPSETQRKKEILKGLLGHVADDDFLINQPFRCDYGKQISIGKRFFANFNFTVLDEARVTIGDDCFIGPNVSIYTFDTIWRTQDEIRTVVNAVIGECIWNLSYNDRRIAIELELTTYLQEEEVDMLINHFSIPADYDGVGSKGTKFVFYM